MHGADEFMDIDNIMIATKVFADAIWELCGDK
jgi:succinyl-diaminopimelate desuccinylase